MRFEPNADFNGNATFSFVAWDQTSGFEGGTLQLAGNTGGDGTFSTGLDTAFVTVSAENDAPVQSGIESADLAYSENDGARLVTSTLAISDVDSVISNQQWSQFRPITSTVKTFLLLQIKTELVALGMWPPEKLHCSVRRQLRNMKPL